MGTLCSNLRQNSIQAFSNEMKKPYPRAQNFRVYTRTTQAKGRYNKFVVLCSYQLTFNIYKILIQTTKTYSNPHNLFNSDIKVTSHQWNSSNDIMCKIAPKCSNKIVRQLSNGQGVTNIWITSTLKDYFWRAKTPTEIGPNQSNHYGKIIKRYDIPMRIFVPV